MVQVTLDTKELAEVRDVLTGLCETLDNDPSDMGARAVLADLLYDMGFP